MSERTQLKQSPSPRASHLRADSGFNPSNSTLDKEGRFLRITPSTMRGRGMSICRCMSPCQRMTLLRIPPIQSRITMYKDVHFLFTSHISERVHESSSQYSSWTHGVDRTDGSDWTPSHGTHGSYRVSLDNRCTGAHWIARTHGTHWAGWSSRSSRVYGPFLDWTHRPCRNYSDGWCGRISRTHGLRGSDCRNGPPWAHVDKWSDRGYGTDWVDWTHRVHRTYRAFCGGVYGANGTVWDNRVHRADWPHWIDGRCRPCGEHTGTPWSERLHRVHWDGGTHGCNWSEREHVYGSNGMEGIYRGKHRSCRAVWGRSHGQDGAHRRIVHGNGNDRSNRPESDRSCRTPRRNRTHRTDWRYRTDDQCNCVYRTDG